MSSTTFSLIPFPCSNSLGGEVTEVELLEVSLCTPFALWNAAAIRFWFMMFF